LKAHVYPEEIVVAWLAMRLGRPVKWIEDRSENLMAASHARDQVVRARVAADADGRLLALDVDVTCDVDAYGVYPHGHILEALGTPAMIPGPYRLERYRSRVRVSRKGFGSRAALGSGGVAGCRCWRSVGSVGRRTFSGPGGGELVAVELGEVVGHRD
jgi:hypothetical protein